MTDKSDSDEYKPKGQTKGPRFEVLPKNLRTRTIPGYHSSLSPIPEDTRIPPSIPTHQSSNPSALDQAEAVPDTFQVDQDSIKKLEDNLNHIKLTLRKDPGTKNWVSFKSIERFPDPED